MSTSPVKILLLCISLMPFVFITKAQPYTTPTPSITVKLDHLGIENGLSQGFVATVLQDSRGFLWIGTKDGLNRFDGYTFKVYRHDLFDPSSIAENEIINITEDDNGRLWIIFRNKGFDIFDTFTEQFTHFIHSATDTASISSNEVYQIFNTGNNNHVIITSHGTDLVQLEKKQKIPKEQEGTNTLSYKYNIRVARLKVNNAGNPLEHAERIRMIQASGNRILVCDTKQLFELKISTSGKTYSYYNLTPPPLAGEKKLSSPSPYIFEDTVRNLLYFQRNVNMLVYDEKNKIWNLLSNSLPVINFDPTAVDAEGNLWLRDEINMIKIDIRKKTKSIIKSDEPEKNSKINSETGDCYKDRTGNIWICTHGYGLYKLNQRNILFHHVSNEKLINTSTYRISISKNGLFNVMTWDFFEYLFDTVNMQLMVTPFSEKTHTSLFMSKAKITDDPFAVKKRFTIRQILDSGGYFIKPIFTNKLAIVDPLRNYADTIFTQGSEYNSPFTDKNNITWFSAGTQILFKVDLLTKKTDSIPFPSTIGNPVLFIAGRNDGNIWVAGKNGLGKYNNDSEKWIVFKKDKTDAAGLRDNNILCLCFDPGQPEKYTWLGFEGGGFCRMENETGKCIYYTTKDGLPNDVVYGILADKKGNLWLSTNKGISMFNPSTAEFKNFNQSDGLQSNEFNRYSSAQSPSGWMMFGGVNGVNYFNPEEINSSRYNADIQLTNITINNKVVSTKAEDNLLRIPLNHTTEWILPHDYNLVSFQFASLDLTAPEKNKFSYKLEGIDNEWSPVSTKHEATYTYLPPRKYIFRVKGTNSDGTWSSKEISFAFTIRPPWWQTWWFRLLVLAVIAGIIWLIFNYRLQQALKLQAIRNRISADMHDEIGSTLSSITFYSQALLMQSNDEKQKQVLEKIKENAQNVQEGLSDIVWSVKASMDNIENVFSRMYSFGIELLEPKSIKLHFEVDEKLHTQKMEMTNRKNFYLIFKEALNNAAKYAQCQNVWVTIEAASPHVHMSIKDDGKGFDVQHAKNGNGLGNLKQRAAEMKGAITIISQPGNGTEITLVF